MPGGVKHEPPDGPIKRIRPITRVKPNVTLTSIRFDARKNMNSYPIFPILWFVH
jgi:hypothetical protein